MKLSSEGKDVLTTRVSDVMSGRPLITVTPEINALEALLIMHRNKIRRFDLSLITTGEFQPCLTIRL